MHIPDITIVPADVSRETSVESQRDPVHPGRTGYRIAGPTAAAVQAEITRLMDEVDEHGGAARFVGPTRIGRGFGAVGEVTLARQGSEPIAALVDHLRKAEAPHG